MAAGKDPLEPPGWGGSPPQGRIGPRIRWIAALALFAALAWMHEHPHLVPAAWARAVHGWLQRSWRPGAPAPAAAPAPGGRWPAPWAGARLKTAFGWQGRQTGARFLPGVWVAVPAGAALKAAVPGRIVAVRRSGTAGPWEVREAPAGLAGAVLVFGGLEHPAVAAGRRLGAGAPVRLGIVGPRGLWVETDVDGLPVDPLARGLFGPAWRP